jgi:hypothetical protein
MQSDDQLRFRVPGIAPVERPTSGLWRSLLAAFSIFLVSGPICQTAVSDLLLPVDEAVSEPDLVRTRAAVMNALRTRNVERLLAFAADDITVHHELGKDQLRDLSSYGDRILPDHMLGALTLGGSFTTTRGSFKGERQFCAPYVYSAYPSDAYELNLLFQHGDEPWAIIGKNVPVRSRPSNKAPVVTRSSYQLVYVPGGLAWAEEDVAKGPPYSDRGWREVETRNGKTGYVDSRLVRNPADYHVCFAQRGGHWLITVVAEGMPAFDD